MDGGRKRTLHRNLFLPEESVREDRPDAMWQHALPSAKTNRNPGSISAMPQQVLHGDEVEVKRTTSELKLEDDGEIDLGESDFDQIFSKPEKEREKRIMIERKSFENWSKI